MIQITRRPLVLVSGCSYRKGATSCHTREIWNVCYAYRINMVGTSSLWVFLTERDFELEPSSSLTSTPIRSQAIHATSAVLVPLLPDCQLILIYIWTNFKASRHKYMLDMCSPVWNNSTGSCPRERRSAVCQVSDPAIS